MATRKISRASRRTRPSSSQQPVKDPAAVSKQPSAEELRAASCKIIEAKTIVQAVVAAHHGASMDGKNYEMSWALDAAVELLEQANRQVYP